MNTSDADKESNDKIISDTVKISSEGAGLLPANHDTVEKSAQKGGNF